MDPQAIYQEYMNRSVLYLSFKFPLFNLDKLSEHMKTNYAMMQAQSVVDPEYYTIRTFGTSTTYLQLNMYPNLFYIFSQLFLDKSVLVELTKDFLSECEKDENKCDEKEVENSIKERKEMDSKKMTKNPPGSHRCHECFKYNPMFASIQLTQQIFKKYQKIPLDLFSIKTCFVDKSVLTSKVSYTRLVSNGHNYDMLMLTHTPIQNISILMGKLTEVWNKQTQTEQECYMIHWLFCIATPFRRGSAGCSKVLLNAKLLQNGMDPVKEKMDFYRQTDWVAIFSPTFEMYWSKKDEMFEIDRDFAKKTFKDEHVETFKETVEMSDAFRAKVVRKRVSTKSVKRRPRKSKSKSKTKKR